MNNAAYAGPFAHTLVTGIVIGSAGGVAQDRMRSEENNGVLRGPDLCQRVCNF